jgi:hypothetical protein
MSSEEMRTELEIFVNKGLQEGWRGWPRHDERGLPRTDRTDRMNRTCGTGRDLGFSDSSYGSYRSN